MNKEIQVGMVCRWAEGWYRDEEKNDLVVVREDLTNEYDERHNRKQFDVVHLFHTYLFGMHPVSSVFDYMLEPIGINVADMDDIGEIENLVSNERSRR